MRQIFFSRWAYTRGSLLGVLSGHCALSTVSMATLSTLRRVSARYCLSQLLRLYQGSIEALLGVYEYMQNVYCQHCVATYACMYVCIYVHIYLYIYRMSCVCARVSMYACMYIRIYICMHIYICIDIVCRVAAVQARCAWGDRVLTYAHVC
jgi:hypothetical protein